MQMIEGQLRFAGFLSCVAVLGNKFSYEAKQSKQTTSLFQLGNPPQPCFHILIYELAYINLPSIRVISDAAFKSGVARLKESLPEKEGQLCPNKVITTTMEVVCEPE